MIKLWLIRHGKTEGNKLSRYIGTTDEPLCQEGTEFLHKMDYPKVQAVYVSPLKRCVQTAEILFRESRYILLKNWQNAISENLKIRTIKSWKVIRTIRNGLTATVLCLFREEKAGKGLKAET